MANETTWRPHSTHGKLSASRQEALPDTAFAFPGTRQLPLTDEGYVRLAIEDFNEVAEVSDEDRDLAFANLQRAAGFYRVPMPYTDWRQLGTRPADAPYKRSSRPGR